MKYDITIRTEVAFSYRIEADSAEEAQQRAEELHAGSGATADGVDEETVGVDVREVSA